MSAAIRILGIDPGLGITGYGVVEKRGAAIAYVASGRIVSDERTPRRDGLGLAPVLSEVAP